ncbi:MAG TPA: hypothetical protein VIF62_01920 [Labilithrix sp.]|jgi:hypothetical protein
MREGRLVLPTEHDAVKKKPRDVPGDAQAPSPFAKILHGLGKEVDRGETMMRSAIGSGGKDLGTSELLALQAGVYRYSEAVDLSAKLVDRASSGVKTVIQGQ